MISHSKPIIIRVQEIVKTIIENVPDGDQEIIDIGLRFEDKGVDKISCKVVDLLRTVWQLIDEKHELYDKQFSGKHLNSIFLQDKVGTLIYDSLVYRSGEDKDKLKKEKNTRVREFSKLPALDKTRVVEITHEQIQGASSEDLLKEPKKEEGGWDDLPFLK